MKCDGKRPRCGRCSQVGDECSYAQSRRGGLDRAALAERRRQVALTVADQPVDHANVLQAVTSRQGSQLFHMRESGNFEYVQEIDDMNPDSQTRLPHLPGEVDCDPLIDAYYENFHIFHPFVIPRKHLSSLCRHASKRLALSPLIASLRFVGNIYRARVWSLALKDDIETSLSALPPSDPIKVQCLVLYSVALFWYDYQNEAMKKMEDAVSIALDLQMFKAKFADSWGRNDPIQSESWRRTWWTLYVLDVYYAGTLGTLSLRTSDLDMTAELPCEESDYESGVSTQSVRLTASEPMTDTPSRTFQPPKPFMNLTTESLPKTMVTIRLSHISSVPQSAP